MDFRPFGLGLGVFIAIILFLTSFLLTLIVGKAKGFSSTVGFNIFFILCFVLLFTWPIEKNEGKNHSNQTQKTDLIFFPRICLLIFLVIVFIRLISNTLQHCLFNVESVTNVKNRHKISK